MGARKMTYRATEELQSEPRGKRDDADEVDDHHNYDANCACMP